MIGKAERGKSLSSRRTRFVKIRDAVVELRADAADQEIIEWRQSPEQNDWNDF